MEDQIKEAKAIINNTSNITVLTGAGISAESRIPTFRGEEGLWRKFRSEELATQEAFQRDPKLVWEWYDWRRGLVKEAKPNPGHYALVNLENEKPNLTLV
ncbi:MAG: Sir2 family NAD-dependent protein deacetylase, partial [Thermodesulfobacteriota bacterium]